MLKAWYQHLATSGQTEVLLHTSFSECFKQVKDDASWYIPGDVHDDMPHAIAGLSVGIYSLVNHTSYSGCATGNVHVPSRFDNRQNISSHNILLDHTDGKKIKHPSELGHHRQIRRLSDIKESLAISNPYDSKFVDARKGSDSSVTSAISDSRRSRTSTRSGDTAKPKFAMVVGGHSHLEGPVDLEVKLILLGDYSVGKSSLLRVLARHTDQTGLDRDDNGNGGGGGGGGVPSSGSPLANRRFSSPTSAVHSNRRALVRSNLQPGGFVEVEFTHQEKRVLARIADTGGQERYRSMTTSYYRGAHGCLLMFDVTKEESFSNLDTWIENIDCYKTNDELSCILVGTRSKSPARRVLYDRAAAFADSRGLPYMELDMDHMTDIRRVFEALLDSVTVTMTRRKSLEITIRPDISDKNVLLPKNVACSC